MVWLLIFPIFLLSACSTWENNPVQEVSPSLTSESYLADPTATLATLPLPGSPTPTPPESPTPTPTFTNTPTPVPTLRQLTRGGCCTQPSWSPDGEQILYIDKPSPEAPAGLWGVSLQGGEPIFFTDRLGIYSPDMQFLAYPERGQTIVERLEDGQRWIIPNGGRAVSFSPDSTQVAWTAGQTGPPFDSARREVWVSLVDGENARRVLEVPGGGFAGWLPAGRLLVSVRLQPPDQGQAFWTVSQEGGPATELVRAFRLRGSLLSPGGDWLAYATAFDPDPSQNGLWLIHTTTGERFHLDKFGSFRWRDAQRLLVIPLPTNGLPQQLWEYDTHRHQESRSLGVPLTDPAFTPLSIANGDWSVSPDGSQLVFVSAPDHNLWLLGLPTEE